MFRAVEAVYKANRSLLSVRNQPNIHFRCIGIQSKRMFLETEGNRNESLVAQGIRRSPHALGRWIYAIVPSPH